MGGISGVIVLILSFLAAAKGEYCITADYGWFGYQYDYCSTGCCGASPNQYCCSTYSEDDNTYIIWIIVGCVVGGIILISCIIACICCCIHQQGHRGTVVQPAPATGVTTIAYTTTPGAPSNTYGYQHQPPSHPPGYCQPVAPPTQPPQYSLPGQSGQDPPSSAT